MGGYIDQLINSVKCKVKEILLLNMQSFICGRDVMAAVVALEAIARKSVWVQLPPPTPIKKSYLKI